MPFDVKGKYLRYRVRKAVKGAKYRIQDIGQKRHTLRLARYNPRTKKWATQTWMFPIKDIKARRKKTMDMLCKLGIKRQALRKVV
jgi:hypothetical protein